MGAKFLSMKKCFSTGSKFLSEKRSLKKTKVSQGKKKCLNEKKFLCKKNSLNKEKFLCKEKFLNGRKFLEKLLFSRLHLSVSSFVVKASEYLLKKTLALRKLEMVYFIPVSWHLVVSPHKIKCNKKLPSKITDSVSSQITGALELCLEVTFPLFAFKLLIQTVGMLTVHVLYNGQI